MAAVLPRKEEFKEFQISGFWDLVIEKSKNQKS
jgi:hypothetical protein